MILSKTILVNTFKNKKLKYYKSLGYNIEEVEIKVRIEDLPLSVSNIVLVKCDYCDREHNRKFVDYNRIISKNILLKYACCRECGLKKVKETNANSVKNPHPMKGKIIDPEKKENILNKRKLTNLEKWGVEHPLQNMCIQEKFKKTHLEKWGTTNFFKTSEFLEKQKNTCLEKWGVNHQSQSEKIKEKIRETNLKKWGVKSTLNIHKSNLNRQSIFSSEEFRKDFEISNHPSYIEYVGKEVSIFNCELGHTFYIKYDNFRTRLENNIPLCTTCYPIDELNSIKEKEVLEFIKDNYRGEIIRSYRDNLEIDIYLPELKIGFEFNGVYWHSNKFKEKNYHLDKLKYFDEKGIRIINIWEDDWIFRKEIIKSQVKNILKVNEKIGARICEIKEIKNTKLIKDFLNENHIQGFVNSKIKIGIFNNDKIIGVMTFDQFEGRKKMNDDEWNLNRFCTLTNINITGGASKLLKYFIDNWKPKRIISYADKNWSKGDVYFKLGFKLIDETKPDYKYLVKNKLIHKSRFRKSYTGISESKLFLPKVWDCGKIKFELLISDSKNH